MVGSGARRIVLYPYGHPRSEEHRELCSAFMLALGGDVHRVIDGPFATIDRFIRYASRIPAVSEGARPIVVLTRTIPLAMTVLNARRKIEIALPPLQRATWAIFLDPAEDPFFEAAARKMGTLDGELATAPMWSGPSDSSFLILSPLVASPATVRRRAAELTASTGPASSTRRQGPPHGPPPVSRPSGQMPAPSGIRERSAVQPAQAPPLRPLGVPWPWKR